MPNVSEGRREDPVGALVRAWSQAPPDPDLREFLPHEAAGEQLVELVRADVLERIRLGRPATIEHYRSTLGDRVAPGTELARLVIRLELLLGADGTAVDRLPALRARLGEAHAHDIAAAAAGAARSMGALPPTESGEQPQDWSGEPDLVAGGDAPRGERVGDRIGPYRLLDVIGEGGFGVVYLAEQREPIERKVALKLIKPGMDSRSVIARFEAERQALALMDHPHIARIFEAGTTDRGRPYFVMEHVRGEPITTYCDRHRLSIDERLTLFAQVCEAVHHAHQKGLIHRDLSPSNILVTTGSKGHEPKVIDFGVAKAIDRRLTTASISIERGVMIGTPEYMAPEQAEMNNLDIDTRVDIYSLGVVLYELLVGAPPLDRRTLRSKAIDAMVAEIRFAERPLPGARLLKLGEDADGVAYLRGTDARALSRALVGRLRWLPMKALRPDRTKRFSSAAAFAADIRRYLTHHDYDEAAEEAAWDRLRRVVVRNRVGFAVGGALVLSLVVASGATTLGMVRTSRALARERAALDQRSAALATVRSLSNSLLTDLYNSIKSVPGATRARQQVVAIAEQYLSDLEKEAETHADVQHDLIQASLALGDVVGDAEGPGAAGSVKAIALYDRALERARDAIAREPQARQAGLDLAACLNKRARHLATTNRVDEAIRCYEEVLQRLSAAIQAEPVDLELAIAWLAASSGKVYALRVANRPDAAESEATLARGPLARLLALFPGDTRLQDLDAVMHSSLGGIYSSRGHFAEAEAEYQLANAARRRLVLVEPSNAVRQRALAAGLLTMSDLFRRTDRARAAADACTEASLILRSLASLDAEDRMTMLLLANVLLERGRLMFLLDDKQEARRSADEAVEVLRAALVRRADDIDAKAALGQALMMGADSLEADRKVEEAGERYEEALRVLREAVAARPSEVSGVLNLIDALRSYARLRDGNWEEEGALALYAESVGLAEQLQTSAPNDAHVQLRLQRALDDVAQTARALGRRAEYFEAEARGRKIAEDWLAGHPGDEAVRVLLEELTDLVSFVGDEDATKAVAGLDALEQCVSVSLGRSAAGVDETEVRDSLSRANQARMNATFSVQSIGKDRYGGSMAARALSVVGRRRIDPSTGQALGPLSVQGLAFLVMVGAVSERALLLDAKGGNAEARASLLPGMIRSCEYLLELIGSLSTHESGIDFADDPRGSIQHWLDEYRSALPATKPGG